MTRLLQFATFLLVAASLTLAPAFAEEPCDANPRWLLVMVVKQESWWKPVNKENSELERVDALSYRLDKERLELVDRCENKFVSIRIDHDDSEKNAETKITQYRQSWQKKEWVLESTYTIWIKESLHDLCRAMRDCADATFRKNQ